MPANRGCQAAAPSVDPLSSADWCMTTLATLLSERFAGYPGGGPLPPETPAGWPAQQRMPNLLVIRPTDNGKSMIVEKGARP